MSNALKLIMAHSCSVFNLVRIQATTITTNTRSIKLLEKLGFIREGTLKNFETVDGINMLASYMYAKIYS